MLLARALPAGRLTVDEWVGSTTEVLLSVIIAQTSSTGW
jgi:hypothetical protein